MDDAGPFAAIVLMVGGFFIVWVCCSAFGKKKPRRPRRSRGSFDGDRLAQSIVDVILTVIFMRAISHHDD